MLNIRKFFEGIGLIPKTSTTADTQGELEVLSSDGKLRYHNGTSVSPVVTEAHSATLTNKSIDADTNTITNIENADIKSGAAIDAAKIHNGSVSNTEFGYLDGVTSSIQTQLNAAVSASGIATLTNKTIDGDDNTLQDISITSLKTDGAAPNTFISRDGSGVVISTKAVPTGAVVGVSDTQTLTGKTIDGDDNTVQDLPLTAIKTNITDASKFIVRDASGIPVSNTKDVPSGVVVGTTDSQTLTNKTLTTPIISSISNTGTLTLPTSTDTLIGRATTDTLTNKTITAPVIDFVVFDDQTTPSNPSAGFYKAYFKSDGKLYSLNSSGVETEIGSAGSLPGVSEIALSDGNGHGSSGTSIRRFTTTNLSTGSDITYADSSTNGATFTINTTGRYAITYTDTANPATGATYGVSVNADSFLATNINSLSYANGMRQFVRNTGVNAPFCCAVIINLTSGDKVRAHTDAQPNSTSTLTIFRIVRIA